VCPAAPRIAARTTESGRLLLLIFFECLVCLLIWWRGVGIARGFWSRPVADACCGWQGSHPCLLRFDLLISHQHKGVVTLPLTLH
jgi:hypothetical protein